MKVYNTLKTQIELLPRITIIYKNGLGIEWLCWGIFFGEEPKETLKIYNDVISQFAEDYANFYVNKETQFHKWMNIRSHFRSGMLQSLRILNGDNHTLIL